MRARGLRRATVVAIAGLLGALLWWPAPVQAAPPPARTPARPGANSGLLFTGLNGTPGMALDAAGNLYVADYGNDRVVMRPVDRSKPQTTVPFEGLDGPTDVAVDDLGNVYAADYGNHRVVEVLADGGQLTIPFPPLAPTGIDVDAVGNVYATHNTYPGAVYKYHPGGIAETLLDNARFPDGLDIGGDGKLWVSFANQYSPVVSFTTAGIYVSGLVSPSLNQPTDVSVDEAGDVYVANVGTHQVLKFPGGLGTGEVVPLGPLAGPVSVAARGGEVYAGEGDRVVELHPPVAQLRVTTSPPVPADILVDGISRDTWGLTWMEMPEGRHTVCFGRVLGYRTPACQDVTLTTDAPTNVVGTFEQQGYLRVTTDPPVDSTIEVNFPGSPVHQPRNNWGMWSEIYPATYDVCFGKVKGYDPPPCQSVTVTAGSNAAVIGVFQPNPTATGPDDEGTRLRVVTDPPVPALLEMGGITRDSWGLAWLRGEYSGYQLCVSEVPGFIGPAEGNCSYLPNGGGGITTVTAHYQPKGYLQVTTVPPTPGTISIDGNPSDAWGVWVGLAPGPHDVCFGPVPGLTAPPCQDDVEVIAGTSVSVAGHYTPA